MKKNISKKNLPVILNSFNFSKFLENFLTSKYSGRTRSLIINLSNSRRRRLEI